MESAEKEPGHKHHLQVYENNYVECKRCKLLCPTKEYPTVSAIRAEPCLPDTPPTKRQLCFSPEWPDRLQSILEEAPTKPWDVMTSSGKRLRLSKDLEEIPAPEDFPLTLEPVADEVLLQEELEQLKLEEELLEEQLQLAEMQTEYKSFLNSTVPASSGKAPTVSFLVLLEVILKPNPLDQTS